MGIVAAGVSTTRTSVRRLKCLSFGIDCQSCTSSREANGTFMSHSHRTMAVCPEGETWHFPAECYST